LTVAPFANEEFFDATGRAVPEIPVSESARALRDIWEGARAWRLWMLLGWQDIRQRYRRSKIGPFWVTLSMGAMIGGMAFLYAGLFHTDVHSYLPSLTLGLIIWGLIGVVTTEECNAFIDGESIIKQVQLPLSLHVYRVVWRNLIIFGHNFVIYIVVAVAFGIWPGLTGLLAIPGLLLVCLNGIWVGIFLGAISVRFRDVPQIIGSVIQIAFFLTPIIWQPESVPGREWILKLNPFYYFVTLVRQPLLGGGPSVHVWAGALATTVFGWLLAFLLYRRCRRRIAYWL
jgi:ABC-type polysaccharide/polyol phosphate export permease